MTEEEFHNFVSSVDWTFAKSVPNWPHFYIVEEELEDQVGYVAARAFIRDHGYDGNFFDMGVRYYDADGWTYWSSPLAELFEAQYMINRCRKEYTWDSLAKAGELPSEGFEGKELCLSPVLQDPEFRSLVPDATGNSTTAFDVLGPEKVEHQRAVLQRHEKLFHALPHLLDANSVRDQCSDAEFEQMKAILAVHNEGEQ